MDRVIVIKIGSGVLTTPVGQLDLPCIDHLASEIAKLIQKQIKCILICSGAVACGFDKVEKISSSALAKRAAAGIGQIELITTLARAFRAVHLCISQVLLTPLVFANAQERRSLAKLLQFSLRHAIVPVINENDVIHLNGFGGNDFLAAEILLLSKAKELFMLSTQSKSRFGVGGASAKTAVTQKLLVAGASVRILDGKAKNVLTLNVENGNRQTRFQKH